MIDNDELMVSNPTKREVLTPVRVVLPNEIESALSAEMLSGAWKSDRIAVRRLYPLVHTRRQADPL